VAPRTGDVGAAQPSSTHLPSFPRGKAIAIWATAGLHITGAIAAAIFAVLAVLVAASARRGAAPEPAPTADAEAEARPAVV
jgi:hypothetical protein